MRGKVLAWILFATMLGACNVGVEAGDRTRHVIDDAVTRLVNNSADWQQVLRESLDALPDKAAAFVREDLTALLQRGIAATGSEIRCVVDFVGKRVLQGVVEIRARLAGEEAPAREPTICHVSPNSVRLSTNAIEVPSVQEIEFSGYDLDSPDIRAMLTDNNAVRDVTNGNLTRQSHYHLTLNIGANGVRLTETSQLITLEWHGQGISSVPMIQPLRPQCKPETRTIYPGTQQVRAQLERGDPEFGTNQPFVSAGVRLTSSDSRVTGEMWMRAWEANGGDTVAAGRRVFNVYTAPTGYRVFRIVTPTSDTVDTYHDTTWEADQRPRAGDGPVVRFHIWGDTHGWDVEPDRDDGTRVDADFRGIVIEVVKTDGCV